MKYSELVEAANDFCEENNIPKFSDKELFAIIIGAIILSLALSFGLTALSFYFVCWAFGLTFSFKMAFGVWVAMALLRSIFKAARG